MPALDFNIARCLDRLEQTAEAIDHYQRYVESAPTPPDAGEVRERIKALQARIAAAARTPVAPPAESPPATRPAATVATAVLAATVTAAAPPHRPLSRRPRVWITVGGVVLVATGIALGVTVGSTTSHPDGSLGTVPGN